MTASRKPNGFDSADERWPTSKELPPFPTNFALVFFKNQFLTRIDIPTKQQYPNAQGKHAIITGSNTGLGLAAAQQLLHLGVSRLIMGVKSLERGQVAAQKLRTINPDAKIDIWELDMESYESVRSFVQKCESLPRIDVAILNAGVGPLHFAISATGHERTIQINHLSTALLAICLVPVLKSRPKSVVPPRLVIVNSATAHLCKFPNKDQRPLIPSFDDTKITPWDPQERYGVSKLLSQLFFVKLAKIVKPEEVTINMVDPGLTKGTALARDATGAFAIALKMFLSITGRPLERAAATYIDAALGQKKDSHGCFLMNCQIAPFAHWFYNDESGLSDTIWSETLQQLDIADIEHTL